MQYLLFRGEILSSPGSLSAPHYETMEKEYPTQKFDLADIRKELAKLLDETEIRAISSHEGALLDTDLIVASLRNRGIAEGAWWAFASAVVSGVAAVVGGIIAPNII